MQRPNPKLRHKSKVFSIIEEANNTLKARLQAITELTNQEDERAKRVLAFERKKFLQFKDIVHLENTYFSVDHIDKLGLPYDICFFVAKKNIGKTWEIYRMIENCIKVKKKFIYLRLSRDELEKSAEAFNNDLRSPVYMCKDKNTWKFYDKCEINQILEIAGATKKEIVKITTKWLKDNGIDFKGYGFEFQFCQSYTGGEFNDFNRVFYDECLSYNPRRVINSAHLANWGAFLSSIARNKTDLKVYMFGNLRDTNTQLLDFYGINRDDNLRYIVRGADVKNGCRILYINAGELYKGIESQGRAARHAGGAIAYQLENNEYLTTSEKLIPPRAFNLMEKSYRFVISFDGAIAQLFDLRNHVFQNKLGSESIWALSVEPLTGFEDVSNNPIYCETPTFFLSYSNLSKGRKIRPFVKIILRCAKRGKLLFLNQDSMLRVAWLMRLDPFDMMGVSKHGF